MRRICGSAFSSAGPHAFPFAAQFLSQGLRVMAPLNSSFISKSLGNWPLLAGISLANHGANRVAINDSSGPLGAVFLSQIELTQHSHRLIFHTRVLLHQDRLIRGTHHSR